MIPFPVSPPSPPSPPTPRETPRETPTPPWPTTPDSATLAPTSTSPSSPSLTLLDAIRRPSLAPTWASSTTPPSPSVVSGTPGMYGAITKPLPAICPMAGSGNPNDPYTRANVPCTVDGCLCHDPEVLDPKVLTSKVIDGKALDAKDTKVLDAGADANDTKTAVATGTLIEMATDSATTSQTTTAPSPTATRAASTMGGEGTKVTPMEITPPAYPFATVQLVEEEVRKTSFWEKLFCGRRR